VPCKAEARRSETPSDFQVVLSSAKKPSAPALASSASAAATERGLWLGARDPGIDQCDREDH
jgi:hypothetical protein